MALEVSKAFGDLRAAIQRDEGDIVRSGIDPPSEDHQQLLLPGSQSENHEDREEVQGEGGHFDWPSRCCCYSLALRMHTQEGREAIYAGANKYPYLLTTGVCDQ